MNAPTRNEVEKSINEHLDKIRNFTYGSLGDEPQAYQLMAYMMANVSHVAELMRAAQVEMNRGINLTTELFKSVYSQFDETNKENENEEAK